MWCFVELGTIVVLFCSVTLYLWICVCVIMFNVLWHWIREHHYVARLLCGIMLLCGSLWCFSLLKQYDNRHLHGIMLFYGPSWYYFILKHIQLLCGIKLLCAPLWCYWNTMVLNVRIILHYVTLWCCTIGQHYVTQFRVVLCCFVQHCGAVL